MLHNESKILNSKDLFPFLICVRVINLMRIL